MKKFSLFLVAAIMTVTTWSQDVTSAYNADKAGEYDKAVGYIEKAITNPKDAAKEKTWRYRGRIYYNIANGSKFASQFPNALQLSMESFFKAMEIDTKNEYRDENLRHLDDLKLLFFNDAQRHYNAGDFCSAVSGFNALKVINDKNNFIDSASIFNEAYCLDRCGRYDEAIAGYKRCGDINYSVPLVYLYISDIYKKQGKKDEAKKVLSDARKAHPKDTDLLRAEVNQLLEEEKYNEAEGLLKSLTESDPNNETIWFVLGVTYEKLNKPAETEAAYKRSVEINPKYFDGLFNLGASYFNKGVKIINEECDKIPPREAAKYDDCVAKSKVEFTRAVEYLERGYAIQPNDKDIISALKEAYLRTENMDGVARMNAALKK